MRLGLSAREMSRLRRFRLGDYRPLELYCRWRKDEVDGVLVRFGYVGVVTFIVAAC